MYKHGVWAWQSSYFNFAGPWSGSGPCFSLIPVGLLILVCRSHAHRTLVKNHVGEAKRMLKTKLSAKVRKTLVNDARKKMYPGVQEEVLLFTLGGRGFGNLKIVSQQSICRQQQVQLNSWAMRGSCTLLPTFFFSWAPEYNTLHITKLPT